MPATATATTRRRSAAQDRALKLFLVLVRASNSVTKRVHDQTDFRDLTPTEFYILEELYNKGPLLRGDIQRKIPLSSGGVTYTVDRLAEKGLVTREECETDRRARWATLTSKGETLIAAVFDDHAQNIEQTLGSLSVREQEQLTTALRKLGLAAASED